MGTIGDFIDYIVSNDPTAYPDGGGQSGYWYEKVVEGKAGIDFGEVALASAAESVTVSHNLGVVPSWVALIPKVLVEVDGKFLLNSNGEILYKSTSDYELYIRTVTNELTANEITFRNPTVSYKYAAVDYYWIAIV